VPEREDAEVNWPGEEADEHDPGRQACKAE
jgi:hypothetical protein